MRPDGRTQQEIRPLTIELSPVRYPAGSALVRLGNTHILCTVTVQDEVPAWRKTSGKGWLTAEYALLPGSTHTRTPRSHTQGGRAQEIRRLIGRSLRRAVDLDLLGPRTLTVDCDVLQADGGTRTASINGGYVAVALAVKHLVDEGRVLRIAGRVRGGLGHLLQAIRGLRAAGGKGLAGQSSEMIAHLVA